MKAGDDRQYAGSTQQLCHVVSSCSLFKCAGGGSAIVQPGFCNAEGTQYVYDPVRKLSGLIVNAVC